MIYVLNGDDDEGWQKLHEVQLKQSISFYSPRQERR